MHIARLMLLVGAGAVAGSACKSDKGPAAIDNDQARPAENAPNSGTGTSAAPSAADPMGAGASAGTTGAGAAAPGATGATGSATEGRGAAEGLNAAAGRDTTAEAAGARPGAGAAATAGTSGAHSSCERIIDKMIACAKDPGFRKYQGRWTKKGAPAAGSKNFEARILAWGAEGGRRSQCEEWVARKDAEAHIGERSKIANLLSDTKLTCTLFGQELDDDGWVPGALRE